MTDKVQKIRKEVERLQDLTMDKNKNFYSEASAVEYYALCNIEHFIDSMQEEPVSNNSALLPCIYNRTLEERVKYCKYCSAACEGRVKEPVSDELEAYSKELADIANWECGIAVDYAMYLIKAGAQWQKEQDKETIELAEDHAMLAGMERMKEQMMKNIWKPADGDDLPEIDREVIALLDNGKVVFAHRPPEYWDGKNIITGKVTRNYPKTYDKGGWNIPDVKYWLDVELPK